MEKERNWIKVEAKVKKDKILLDDKEYALYEILEKILRALNDLKWHGR